MLDAAVVGAPDERAGERPHAFVVVGENAVDAEIVKAVNETLAEYKHLSIDRFERIARVSPAQEKKEKKQTRNQKSSEESSESSELRRGAHHARFLKWLFSSLCVRTKRLFSLGGFFSFFKCRSIPKSASGKILRRILKDELLAKLK